MLYFISEIIVNFLPIIFNRTFKKAASNFIFQVLCYKTLQEVFYTHYCLRNTNKRSSIDGLINVK